MPENYVFFEEISDFIDFGYYIVGNSFRMELEMVLTNCPECVKSDYKSWRGRIENSFNKLAAGI